MDHQSTFDGKMVYIQVDNVLVIFFFFFCFKALANVGPKGELLATSSSVLSKNKMQIFSSHRQKLFKSRFA